MKYVRIALVALVSWYFWSYAQTFRYEWHFIDNINLIFHEAGHAIFFFLGEYVKIAMGSGLQVLLPLSLAIYFFFDSQRISSAICLMWSGQNLLNVSIYAGDAIRMQLPLLGGDNVIHDWNYLLSNAGVLQYTKIISEIIYWSGITFIGLGTLLGLFFAWNYIEDDF